jgi:hypothetical protein
MSISYIERLRESHKKEAAYMRGIYGSSGLLNGISKLSDFFYGLDKDGGIVCYEEHTGNVERRFEIRTESLYLSVFCTPQSYPTFSLHSRIYEKTINKSKKIGHEHILETSDVDALISYIYFLIGSVDPERGKWIKLR